MLNLPDVTLCCVDTKRHHLAIRSLLRSMREARFGRVVFLTDALPSDVIAPDTVEIRKIEQIRSLGAYSEFMLKGLLEHIDTEHALVTQWDGYIVHGSKWDPEFARCDYVGAVWPAAAANANVGNGGFSLRSRKLLAALQDGGIESSSSLHEDQTICSVFRPLLEREYGIRFASPDLANRFSFERDQAIAISGTQTFGFHGLFNMFLVESEPELIAMTNQLTDDMLRSESCRQLLSNCYNFKQWRAAVALGRRILEADPDNYEVADMTVDAGTMQQSSGPPDMTPTRSTSARVFRRILGRK